MRSTNNGWFGSLFEFSGIRYATWGLFKLRQCLRKRPAWKISHRPSWVSNCIVRPVYRIWREDIKTDKESDYLQSFAATLFANPPPSNSLLPLAALGICLHPALPTSYTTQWIPFLTYSPSAHFLRRKMHRQLNQQFPLLSSQYSRIHLSSLTPIANKVILLVDTVLSHDGPWAVCWWVLAC